MTDARQEWRTGYGVALQDFLAGRGEAATLRAYQLGRQAMAVGFGLMELAAAHGEALASRLQGATSPEEGTRLAKETTDFLAEALAPFEMAQRGFIEANGTLLRLNEDLERQVVAVLDRFAAVLGKGRAIVTALSQEGAIAATRDAATSILRAERCVYLSVSASADTIAIRAVHPSEAEYSQELVKRAVTSGETVVFSADQQAETEADLVRAGVKSALCAPIKVRSDIGGCLYVTSTRVAGLFGVEEARLGTFIATLAAAALENVRSVAELEASHQAMQTELERRVADRTAALEASNKELEAFSYSVSHDLRAPLRAINGFTEIVMREYPSQLEGEAKGYLERVSKNAQNMGQLIDDLLAFSRLGRTPLDKRTVATAEVVQNALEQLRAETQGRPVELLVGELPECQGEPVLLEQVFANLIGNALKYSRGREPARIEVGCQQEPGSREAVFFVKDNGVGFDMQYADKLFGVFQRLHRAEEYEGTGVGLAIVQRIVHRHGGRVWAKGETGKGATFYFTLGAGAEWPSMAA